MKTEKIIMENGNYPVRLLPFRGMPKVLYARGKRFPEGPACAIVGARLCSSYGKRQAYAIGKYLAQRGVAVISGLAAGVDGSAHEGALDAGGMTAAVLGCGADLCYPAENRKIYERILCDGLVLSEYPDGTKPMPYHFPLRNRIISALSDVVVVVEARAKSGSLITADWALEHGITVCALPGRIEDPLSAGTNYLIAQGAEILWSYEALFLLIEELYERRCRGAVPPAGRKEAGGKTGRGTGKPREETVLPEQPETKDLTPEGEVLAALRERPCTADELMDLAGLSLPEVQGILIRLLMEGKIREPAGGAYTVER